MIDDLKNILELNEIDKGIVELERKKEDVPAEIERLENSQKQEKQMFAEYESKIKGLEAENRSLESDIAELKENLIKSEEKLKFITTNAEYDAVHKEIASGKSRISAAEDKIIQILSDLEALNKSKAEAEQKLKGEEYIKNEENLNRIKAGLSTIETDIGAEKAKRSEQLKKVSKKFLRVYERLYKAQRNGKCVGVVTDQNRICNACACSLTPQKFIEVKRNNSLQLCESCGSILIWKKE